MVEDIIFLQNYGLDCTISEMLLEPDDFRSLSDKEKKRLEEFVDTLVAIIKKAIKDLRLYGKMRPEQCISDLRVFDTGIFSVYVNYSYYTKLRFNCCFNRNNEHIYWNEMNYVNYLLEQRNEGIRFELGNITKYPISYRIIVTRSSPKNGNN